MYQEYAERLDRVAPSMIMALVRKARDMAAAGMPVIDLGIGEPDFTTPEHVKAAAIEAIKNNETRYTVVAGTPALRQAVCDKLSRENGLAYEANSITVCGGAKAVLYNAMMATLSPGREVVIPAPYWPSYPDLVQMADGVPVIVDCPQEQDFLISPQQLEGAITPATRWFLLNSPSNPSGGVYSAAHLEQLAEVLRRHPHVGILSDDIYEHLVFDGARFTSILNVAPDLQDRTLVVNGVSKAYSMTGWRIGYAAGPRELITRMNMVQGHSTTHACSISQAASVAALEGPDDFIRERMESFEARRDIVLEQLSLAKGITCRKPAGAFYILPSCAGLIGKKTPGGQVIESDVAFCSWLLEEFHVSTVPGSAFGLSPHFRISTAAKADDLHAACARITEACASLS